MAKKEAFLQFLKAARSLQDRGLSKEAIVQFAKNEFGELSELFKKQIDSLFKPKKGIENIKIKDEVFDDTVIKLPVDDTGVPFNPKDPTKQYGKPKKSRMLDEDEIAELDMDIGGLEYTNDFDGTVESANKLRKERAKYIADMELEYKKGNLDPVAGDKSPARKRFLEKKLEEMEASGDSKLMTRDEIEELNSFDLQIDMDKAIEKFKNKDLPTGFQTEKFIKDFPVTREEAEKIAKLPNDERKIILKKYIDEDMSRQITLMDYDPPKGRKPNAEGGIAGYYTGGMVDVEPNLSDIGHGSDALMARTRLVSPDGQATTSTGLNYLLAEDNDNIRVPFKDGLKVYPKIMASKSNQGLGNGKNVDLQDLTYGGTLMYDQGPFSAGIEYLKGKDKFDFKDTDDTLVKDTTDRELANLILMMKLKNGSIKFKGNKDNQMINLSKSFAQGGRIGFSKGKLALADAARRKFMKTAGGIGAGIAALKTGLLGFGKEAAPVAKETVEAATSAIQGVPPYFFKLVEKIKNFGVDTPKLAVKDREVVTTYKDYTLTEDVVTGEKTIQRMKIDDDLKYDASEYYGKPVGEETYMSYRPGKGQIDETTKGKTPPDEYTEDTSLIRSDRPAEGEIMDTFDGVPDDVIEEAMEKTIKIGKASGGIARMIGE